MYTPLVYVLLTVELVSTSPTIVSPSLGDTYGVVTTLGECLYIVKVSAHMATVPAWVAAADGVAPLWHGLGRLSSGQAKPAGLSSSVACKPFAA